MSDIAPLWNELAKRRLLSIVQEAAELYHVRPEEILGRGRSKSIARARHSVFLSLRVRGLSYPEIGRLMGRDHTTVLAVCQRMRVA